MHCCLVSVQFVYLSAGNKLGIFKLCLPFPSWNTNSGSHLAGLDPRQSDFRVIYRKIPFPDTPYPSCYVRLSGIAMMFLGQFGPPLGLFLFLVTFALYALYVTFWRYQWLNSLMISVKTYTESNNTRQACVRTIPVHRSCSTWETEIGSMISAVVCVFGNLRTLSPECGPEGCSSNTVLSACLYHHRDLFGTT